MNNRIKNLIECAYEKNIDNIIITDAKNMHYYSGFYNGEGYIIAGKDGFKVVTDSRYSEYAQGVCEGFEVCDITSVSPETLVSSNSVCGFEDKSVSYAQYSFFAAKLKKLTPVENMLYSFREVKDKEEINSIKKAVAIADSAFSHICNFIKVGMTEKEVAAEIDCYMKKHGASGNSFDTITASGANGSLPHAIPSDRKLSDGDLVVMDYGCVVDGYCSDMTRTVAVGKISDEKRAVYDTVLGAQLSAISKIASGALANEVDRVARDIINKDYSGRFGHSLGHGVGLDIHELPNLSPKNAKPLQAGNVVTVEPGIYIPGLCGVRIEDMVVVEDGRCQILTQSPKELICVE